LLGKQEIVASKYLSQTRAHGKIAEFAILNKAEESCYYSVLKK
jgi:hypothetical protein